jgi:hypothetical protein
MKNYLIKIDELEEIIFKLTTMEIAKDKACELISEICEKRALTIPVVVPKEEFTEVLGVLKDVYGWNDTNELTEIQAELVNDVISVVKKLNTHDVINWVKLEDEEPDGKDVDKHLDDIR